MSEPSEASEPYAASEPHASDDWNGRGLPPGARVRVDELRRSGTWTSALSTGEFAAIRSVGFEPVGQVMGSAVFHIGRAGRYWGYYDCLYLGSGFGLSMAPAPVALSGAGAPVQRLVQVYDEARATALGRLTDECAGLGGDGVVSAELTIAPFPAQPDCLEFKVIGTAVRAQGAVRPPHPFTSHLDGQGFAKLVSAGWVPVELLVGMSIGLRHDDYQVAVQAQSWANTQVDGWTELVAEVRADARNQLELQAERRGGDGVILASGTLSVWGEACQRSTLANSEAHDHVAEAQMIGTTVARFSRTAAGPRTLAVMPLDRRSDRLRRRLAAVASSPYGSRAEYREILTELRDLGDQG